MDVQSALYHFYQFSDCIRGYSKDTIRRYRYGINTYVTHAHITTFSDITPENVRELFYWGRIERKWKASTYNCIYKSLRVFFTWAQKQGYMTANPTDGLEKPRIEKSLPLRLTKADALRLLEIIYHYPWADDFIRYRNHAIFSTFLFAGVRLNELLNLKVGDIDLENSIIMVRKGKGNKDRAIPISEQLHLTLDKYIHYRRLARKTCPELFTSTNRNQGMTPCGIKRQIEKLRGPLGIKFSSHKLRHTFATLMLEGGCDIYSLSQMMGHSDIKTTTIYLYATPAHLKKQIEKHPLNEIY